MKPQSQKAREQRNHDYRLLKPFACDRATLLEERMCDALSELTMIAPATKQATFVVEINPMLERVLSVALNNSEYGMMNSVVDSSLEVPIYETAFGKVIFSRTARKVNELRLLEPYDEYAPLKRPSVTIDLDLP